MHQPAALPLRLPVSLWLAGCGLAADAGVWVARSIPAEMSSVAWLVFVLGALASTLLAALLWQRSISLRRAETLLAHTTAEIAQLALVAQATSNAVVITDVARRITWVNAGFERISGYSAAEVMGRTPGELLQFEGTAPHVIAHMRRALNAGQAFAGDVCNRGKQGRIYWLELDIQPIHDAQGVLTGFMAIQTDITERKQAEANLRASEAFLDKTGRIGGVGGWAYDLRSHKMHWTDQTCRILEVEPGHQPTLQECPDFFTPQARTVIEQAMTQGFGDDRLGWDFKLQFITARGRVIWVHAVAEGEFDDSGPVRVVGALRDITGIVLATEAVERSSRAKSEFIANISHELRTPLQSVIGFSELGEHFSQLQAQRQFQQMFNDIQAGGQRMLTLVNGLLDISTSDSADSALTLHRVDLAALATEAAQQLQAMADARQLRLVLPDPSHALPAHADPARMQQVLRHVLNNALRFAPEGSLIEISSEGLDGTGHVALTVRDHGPGIPPEELEAIFEPFVQSSRTRDGSGGTGLGLTICRKIMRAHGGSIEAFNAPGGGTLIRLQLKP